MDKNDRRGVTLIEMLIAMSVSGLVLIAVLGIFSFSTRRLGTQTGRAQTLLTGNQGMNAICKEAGQAVSFGYDQNGDIYFLMPASTDAQGNAQPTLLGGLLGYSTSATAVKFYASDATGATQASNTGNGNNGAGVTALWRATTTKLNGNPKWQPDAAWSRSPSPSAMPKYPDMTSLTFTPYSGLPANTIRVTLTLADREGNQASTYTVSRCVYLSNHN